MCYYLILSTIMILQLHLDSLKIVPTHYILLLIDLSMIPRVTFHLVRNEKIESAHADRLTLKL